jgi:hypothetical protein
VSPRPKLSLLLATLLAGCLQQDDPAYLPVSLQPPYSDISEAPPGTPIEPGMPIKLDPRQQEAIVAAVSKWMKNPASASFGAIAGVKLRQGRIAVCGEVDGRNSAGAYPGMSRFVGVMMGTTTKPEFVVVGIAQAGQPRAEIDSICQRSGIF